MIRHSHSYSDHLHIVSPRWLGFGFVDNVVDLEMGIRRERAERERERENNDGSKC